VCDLITVDTHVLGLDSGSVERTFLQDASRANAVLCVGGVGEDASVVPIRAGS